MISSYVRFGEGDDRVMWPHPADPNDIEWRMRYKDPELYDDSKGARLVAASYIHAYRELVRLPQRQRNKVIQQIRAAATEED